MSKASIKVLLYSQDVVGKSMAGPGIRYWELAGVLSKYFRVTLLTPNVSDLNSQKFKLKSISSINKFKEIGDTDIVISQKISSRMVSVAKKAGTKIILDIYDPIILEALELYKYIEPSRKIDLIRAITRDEIFSYKNADAYICASEKQRDLWLGALMVLEKISLNQYIKDPSLRSLIDVVSFGLQDQMPNNNGPGLKKMFGFGHNDKIILWGGGIWNWFDPLTLIKAIDIISRKRKDIKLVFLGLKRPHGIKMEMATKAISLAKKLGLEGNAVYFNYGWVPYHERHNYFSEATIGVSTHLDHIETRFSFRTRMLDYIWARLPIIATEGDSFAEIISKNKLGEVVPYKNSVILASAIESLVDDEERISKIKKNLGQFSQNLTWEVVARPMVKIINSLAKSKKQKLGFVEGLPIYVGELLFFVKRIFRLLFHPAQLDAFLSRFFLYLRLKGFIKLLIKGDFSTINKKTRRRIKNVVDRGSLREK